MQIFCQCLLSYDLLKYFNSNGIFAERSSSFSSITSLQLIIITQCKLKFQNIGLQIRAKSKIAFLNQPARQVTTQVPNKKSVKK